MGPREHNNTNAPIPPDDRATSSQSEMNNPAIEPVAKKYAELRYQLMPYTYTLAREARDAGLPLMRAMWLHYPDDARARGLGKQYPVGPRPADRAGLHEGRDVARRLSADGRVVRLVDEREARPAGRRVTRAVDLATMPIYVRAGAIIPVDPVRQYTSEPVDRADDAPGVSRRQRPVHAVRRRRHQPGVSDGQGHLDADDVERSRAAADDRARRPRRRDQRRHRAGVQGADAAGGTTQDGDLLRAAGAVRF